MPITSNMPGFKMTKSTVSLNVSMAMIMTDMRNPVIEQKKSPRAHVVRSGKWWQMVVMVRWEWLKGQW